VVLLLHVLRGCRFSMFRWEIALECGGGLTLKPCYLPHNVSTEGQFTDTALGSFGFLILNTCFIIQECMKLYLVRLPESRKFIVPKNLKLLAVPLCQVHENHKVQLFKRIRKHQWYLDVLIDQVSAQHSTLWKIYLVRFYLALLCCHCIQGVLSQEGARSFGILIGCCLSLQSFLLYSLIFIFHHYLVSPIII